MDPWVPGCGLHHISLPNEETSHNYTYIKIVVACNCTIIIDNKPRVTGSSIEKDSKDSFSQGNFINISSTLIYRGGGLNLTPKLVIHYCHIFESLKSKYQYPRVDIKINI